MKVLFHYTGAQAIKSSVMMHTFMVIFCFYIEIHRKETVINCCELKKLKIKRRLLLYACYNVYVIIMWTNVAL